MKPSVRYLGYVINGEDLHPEPEKVVAISKVHRRNDVKQLCSFLGLVNYYRKSVPDFTRSLRAEMVLDHRM